MDRSRGMTIALLGVVLFATTMVAGAATAPDRNVVGTATTTATDSTPTPTPTPTTISNPPGTATGTDPVTTDANKSSSPSPSTSTSPSPSTSRSPTAPPGSDRPQTLVGMQGTWATKGSVFMLDGKTIRWKTTAGNPEADNYADSYFDVTRLPNGTILAGFIDSGYQQCGPYEAPCDRTGYRLLDPDAPGGPKVISEYSFPVRSATNSEVHDVERLGPGRYLLTDMDRERIFEVTNGTVTWQWNASSFYDAPPDPTRRDWLHINDVDVIGEGRYLVSVRNANQLVVVDRGTGVVEVVNADNDAKDESCLKKRQLADFDDDGKVNCGDPAVLNHQHNPQWIGPGAVLVADSDNNRVVELHRTEDGDWEPVWSLERAGGIKLDWPRDADRLPNGHTLVTDTLNKRIFEIAPNGTVVWSVATNRLPYEAERLPYGEIAGGYGGTTTPTDRTTRATGTGSTATDDSGTGAETGTGTTGGTGTATSGERTALPTVGGGSNGDVSEPNDEGIPVLTLAVVALRGTFSWLPVWFRELHLGLTIVSVGLVLGGGVDHLRTTRDLPTLSALLGRE